LEQRLDLEWPLLFEHHRVTAGAATIRAIQQEIG
jgi:hypothetical protein